MFIACIVRDFEIQKFQNGQAFSKLLGSYYNYHDVLYSIGLSGSVQSWWEVGVQ